MTKVVNNIEEAKALSVELQKEVNRLKGILSKLETNITLIQSGNIWNGANAYEVNKALNGHLDHDKTLLNKLEKCSLSLEEIVK
jgi:sialic acid synthase SpsE